MDRNQRALWTFLFFTLLAPFFASVLAAGYTPFAIWANWPPFTAGDHTPYDPTNIPDSAGLTALIGQAAIRSYVWAAIPAGLTGAILAILLLSGRSFSWAIAGAAGVIGFMLAYIIFPFPHGGLIAGFSAVAGLVAAAMELLLRRVGVAGDRG